MPFLTIYTNSDVIDANITVEAANLVAKQLSKPIRYVVVNIINNKNMIFDGGDKKGALIEMKSIGFANKRELAELLTDFIEDKLQVERGLINLEFVDMPSATVSIGGSLLG